ncbi:MAG: TonB-dependent receptor [Alistipes sp.]|nr:TonB-dependent receptor [Alistipes sp.]
MVRKVVLSMVATLVLGCFGAFAQGQRVTGTVTDESGTPVIGAAVVVKGTTRGTSTDVAGFYEIAADANATLEFTYLGMQTQEVAVAGRTSIDVVLLADSEQIEEVIVQAFGTAKKEAFTGSAATIKSDDLQKTQSSNVANALSGKVAGLQTSQGSGSLGSEPTIRIRGIGSINAGNDPLWVVDGVPYEGDKNNINMADIETMTVLKDAASNALYGARGANGVIMITTKRAKAGDARVNFDAKWGVNMAARQLYDYTRDPGQYYEMHYASLKNYYMYGDSKMEAPEAHIAANNALTSNGTGGLGYNVFTVPAGQTLIGSNGKLNPNATLGRKFEYNGQEYYVTPDDWYDELYDPSFRQEYNVSIAAASEKSNFFASFGYLNNNGITDGSNMYRYTARLRADYQAKKWLKVGANMSYTNFSWDGASSTNEGDGSTGDAFGTVAGMAPIYPVYLRDGEGNIMYEENKAGHDYFGKEYDEKWPIYDTGDGSRWGLQRFTGQQSNPLQNIWLDQANSEGNAFSVNGFADFTILPGLVLTINGSVTIDETRSTSLKNPYYGQFAANKGIVTKSHGRSYNHNLQQLLNYNKSFGANEEHNIQVLLGHETYNLRSYSLGGFKSNVFSTDNLELNGAVVDGKSVSSSFGEYVNEGYFVRGMYEYDGRIFASASYRRDASSRFHPDHRWGNFWSVGAAWILNRESWFNAPAFNMLKVKASYGSQGNDAIGMYKYTDLYSISNDGNDGISIMFGAKGNPDITWETNANLNLGVEFGLWNDRLSGSVDYFYRLTSDMLFSVPVAPSMGYSSYYANIGDMSNTGIEVVLNGDIIRTKNVVWSLSANLTWVKNKVLSLPEQRKDRIVDGHEGFISGSTFLAEGLPLNTLYILDYAGVERETGKSQWWKYVPEVKDPETEEVLEKATWEKTSNYGSIASDQDSKKLFDSTLADVFGGFTTTLYAYGFDLSIAFDYQLGGTTIDGAYAGYMNNSTASSLGKNYHLDLLDAWTTDNKDSQIPRFQFADEYTSATSSRFLISSNYLNISNINVGYSFPAKWWKGHIQNLRVYVACDNVWYWSARKGFDPRGGGNGLYSPIRTISGGVTLTF